MLLVDDAERIGDAAGAALQALLATRPPDLHVVAAGRPEFLRGIYKHLTKTVPKSRVGCCSDRMSTWTATYSEYHYPGILTRALSLEGAIWLIAVFSSKEV